MSEEESKAIYRLNFHKEGAGIGSGMIIVNKADVETVLNMIEEKNEKIERSEVEYHDLAGEIYRLETELEKKDKEIEKLSKSNKRLLRKLRNRVKEVKKLEKYSLYKQEFSRLNEQLKEKEKEVQQYFETTIIQAQKFDAEDEKKNEIIDLMAGAIDSLDSQLVICKYKDKEDVKKKFEEYFERKVENEIQEEN